MIANIRRTKGHLLYMYPVMESSRDASLLSMMYADDNYYSFFKYYESEHRRLMRDAINANELYYDMTEIIELQEELTMCIIEYYELFIKQGEE